MAEIFPATSQSLPPQFGDLVKDFAGRLRARNPGGDEAVVTMVAEIDASTEGFNRAFGGRKTADKVFSALNAATESGLLHGVHPSQPPHDAEQLLPQG